MSDVRGVRSFERFKGGHRRGGTCFDLMADGWLGKVQPSRGARQMPELGDRHEGAQLKEFHGAGITGLAFQQNHLFKEKKIAVARRRREGRAIARFPCLLLSSRAQSRDL